MRVLVLGAGGQVGRAVTAAFDRVTALTREQLDLAALGDGDAGVDWAAHDVVVNAAAWTDVDGAETPDGRRGAWRANATGVSALAVLVARHGLPLVHLSTEYVFDGRSDRPYREDDPIAPLSVYGASKAAGDLAVRTLRRHYLVRPTWLVGQGRNFVDTMLGLAGRGVEPTVVADQVGRPTFAADLAAAIARLVRERAPYGTYHVTGGGPPASWAEVARATFDLAGRSDLAVHLTTTERYRAGRPASAVRPLNSVLDTARAERAGVPTPDWRESLARHVRNRRAATV